MPARYSTCARSMREVFATWSPGNMSGGDDRHGPCGGQRADRRGVGRLARLAFVLGQERIASKDNEQGSPTTRVRAARSLISAEFPDHAECPVISGPRVVQGRDHDVLPRVLSPDKGIVTASAVISAPEFRKAFMTVTTATPMDTASAADTKINRASSLVTT